MGSIESTKKALANMGDTLNRLSKGSGNMVDNGITITMDRFAELIRKEVAYNIKADEVEADVKAGRYVSEIEKALFSKHPFEKDGE